MSLTTNCFLGTSEHPLSRTPRDIRTSHCSNRAFQGTYGHLTVRTVHGTYGHPTVRTCYSVTKTAYIIVKILQHPWLRFSRSLGFGASRCQAGGILFWPQSLRRLISGEAALHLLVLHFSEIHSTLLVNFHLQRHMGNFVIQVMNRRTNPCRGLGICIRNQR